MHRPEWKLIRMNPALATYVPPSPRQPHTPATDEIVSWMPGPPNIEDQQLAECVQRALCGSGYSGLRAVTATSCDRAITLLGEVPSYFMKQMAQEVARAVSGHRSIVNHLIVNAQATTAQWNYPRASHNKGSK